MRCSISGCENEAFYKKSKLCASCYSSIYYWQQKSPTAVMHRVHRLDVFKTRMMVVTPANVRQLRRRAG